MPRALITGITGQDGLYLAELLLAKGYEVFGLIRGQNNPKRALVEQDSPGRQAAHRRPHRPVQPDAGVRRRPARRGLQPRRDLVRRVLLGERRADQRRHRHGRAQHARGDPALLPATTSAKVRFYQASSSEMFGKVQQVPQSETTLLWPRSPYGVAKVFGHYMTINYRESYGMHASLGHPVQPRVAAPRPGVRDPQGHPGGRPDQRSACRTSSSLGNLDAQRDWGFAGDYVEAMWLMLQQDDGRRLRRRDRRDALDPRAARRRVRPGRHRRLGEATSIRTRGSSARPRSTC